MTYTGIGILNPKTPQNVGTLLRTAFNLNADFIFMIGMRYKRRQASDTVAATLQIPFYEFDTFEDFNNHRPKGAQLVAIELDERAKSLDTFVWPKQSIILLGAEDNGIAPKYLARCQHIVQIPSNHCLNVSAAGAIALYHRNLQLATKPGIRI